MGSIETRELCPLEDAWEIDWMRLEPQPVPSRLSVIVAPVEAPSLEGALFEGSDMGPPTLIRSQRGDSGETVELVTQVEAQKEIFVRVTSEGTLERLAAFPTYQ